MRIASLDAFFTFLNLNQPSDHRDRLMRIVQLLVDCEDLQEPLATANQHGMRVFLSKREDYGTIGTLNYRPPKNFSATNQTMAEPEIHLNPYHNDATLAASMMSGMFRFHQIINMGQDYMADKNDPSVLPTQAYQFSRMRHAIPRALSIIALGDMIERGVIEDFPKALRLKPQWADGITVYETNDNCRAHTMNQIISAVVRATLSFENEKATRTFLETKYNQIDEMVAIPTWVPPKSLITPENMKKFLGPRVHRAINFDPGHTVLLHTQDHAYAVIKAFDKIATQRPRQIKLAWAKATMCYKLFGLGIDVTEPKSPKAKAAMTLKGLQI